MEKESTVRSAKTLAGRRILVTRAPEQAGSLAEALQAKGAEILLLPTIDIVPPESYAPLDAALKKIESFDWLIFTSANGVAAFSSRRQALHLPISQPAEPRVAVVGPATARAAKEAGLSVDVMPGQYVAEAVAEALRERVRGKRVLLVRAAVARDVIPDELRRHGAEVHVADAYQTTIPAASIRTASSWLGQGTGAGNPLPDAVTFTSSSTVKHFLALLHAAGVERPIGLRAVSIGPVTTRTLREEAWEPAAEASRADIAGVVEACEKLFIPS